MAGKKYGCVTSIWITYLQEFKNTIKSRLLQISLFCIRLRVQYATLLLALPLGAELRIALHIFVQVATDSLKETAQAPASHHLIVKSY